VRARGREWVVLPNPAPNTLKLRPLGGGDQQVATLFLPLGGHDVSAATFPSPDPSQSGSQSSALLLRDALLLKLRAGAGPFRSLGNLALNPRAYQLVPLLMALKQSVTRVLQLRLRHQLHQSRWTASQYEALPDLLVEECLTARVTGDGLEPLEGAAALELLETPASGNLDPGQRQQWLQEAVAELDALQPALSALAQLRAQQAEDDHRRVREASLRSGEALRMRFRCEPSLPVDVIGLIVLLPAPQL
jgi:hypothetical protein